LGISGWFGISECDRLLREMDVGELQTIRVGPKTISGNVVNFVETRDKNQWLFVSIGITSLKRQDPPKAAPIAA
jgi:hypothetical protein